MEKVNTSKYIHRDTLSRGLECVMKDAEFKDGGNYLTGFTGALIKFLGALLTGAAYNGLADIEIDKKSEILDANFKKIAIAICTAAPDVHGNIVCEIKIGAETYILNKSDGDNINIYNEKTPNKQKTLLHPFKELQEKFLKQCIRKKIHIPGLPLEMILNCPDVYGVEKAGYISMRPITINLPGDLLKKQQVQHELALRAYTADYPGR